MARNQIQKRLNALLEYEMTVHRNRYWPGETPEAVDRELDRIESTRSKLSAMIRGD